MRGVEGRMERKQQIGRPRCKTLDWITNRDNGYVFVSELNRDGKVQKNTERLVPNLPLGREPKEEE